MVRTYKKKTNQHSWSTENMEKAVHSVMSGEMGYKKAAKAHGVPQTTLERYVAKYKANPDSTVFIKKLGCYTTVFTTEQENELIRYIKIMEERLYGFTSQELRKLAFSLAEKNKIKHRFNTTNGLAGVDWLKGFLKRHSDISYQKPEPTSAARAMGFNRVAVSNFFELLEKSYDKHKLNSHQILTGVSTVSKKHSKILASCGERQVKRKTAILTESNINELVALKFTKESTEMERNHTKSMDLSSDKPNKKRKILVRKPKKIKETPEEDAEGAECIYCGYLRSQSTEGWIRCIKCKRWAHCFCAEEDDKDDEVTYVCDLCVVS